MIWWQIYVGIVIISGAMALILTPIFQQIAEKTDFLDCPREQAHKLHRKSTPLLGGPAIFLAWMLTIIGGFFVPHFINMQNFGMVVAESLPGMHKVTSNIIFLCIGAGLAMLLGLYDDRYNMSAKAKFAGQFAIAAIAATWGGAKITVFIDSEIISWIMTVCWIMLIINAINFFDNMDGLAIGTGAIALSLFTVVAAINQQYFVAALSAAAAGSAIGFWFFNHSPATIFMGDSGSHFLGYILAVVSAYITFYNPHMSHSPFPAFIPLFILAIPLFDTAAVVVIRLYKRKPIYIGDHNHLSHRFYDMGMSRKSAVFVIHLLEIIIGLSVLPLVWGDTKTTVIILLQAGFILLLVSVLQYTVITHHKNGKDKSD